MQVSCLILRLPYCREQSFKVPFLREAGWSLEILWALWRREIFVAVASSETTVHSSVLQPVRSSLHRLSYSCSERRVFYLKLGHDRCVLQLLLISMSCNTTFACLENGVLNLTNNVKD